MIEKKSRMQQVPNGVIGLLIALMLCLVACTTQPTQEPPTPSSVVVAATATPQPAATPVEVEDSPKRGGELRLLGFVDVQGQTGLDPAFAIEFGQWLLGDIIFETLVELTPDDDFVPALADSWDISEDGLAYTFHLHEGVKFHNGRELTAADVKFTLERLADPEVASPRQGIFSIIDRIETPDDYTAIVNLSEPYAPFLSALSHVSAAIIPQEEIEAGEFSSNPVGTGAFILTEWLRDERVTFEANPDYWRPGLPYLDRIVVTFNSDDNARVAAFRAGDVDFLHEIPTQFVDVLQDENALQIFSSEGAGLSWQHLQLNTQRPPFDNVLLRQTIFAALNREELALAGKPGHSSPIDAGFLPDWHWAALNDTVWEQDYGRARELMTEAGHPEGFSFTILVVAGFEFQTRTAQAIQQQLLPLGIDAEVEVLDPGLVLSSVNEGNFDALVLVFTPTFDPDERFQQTFMTGGGTNWVGFSHETLDQLAGDARRTTDREERARLYREAQMILAQEGGWASLYMYRRYDAAQAYVAGYTFYPQFYYRSLRNIWLDQ